MVRILHLHRLNKSIFYRIPRRLTEICINLLSRLKYCFFLSENAGLFYKNVKFISLKGCCIRLFICSVYFYRGYASRLAWLEPFAIQYMMCQRFTHGNYRFYVIIKRGDYDAPLSPRG